MGFLQTIVLHNDAMGEFEKDPKAFGEAILKAMKKADETRREESWPIGNYCNYITAHPSRHADDHTVYVHKGNTVLNINGYNTEFLRLCDELPDVAKDFVKEAQVIVDTAKEELQKRMKKA